MWVHHEFKQIKPVIREKKIETRLPTDFQHIIGEISDCRSDTLCRVAPAKVVFLTFAEHLARALHLHNSFGVVGARDHISRARAETCLRGWNGWSGHESYFVECNQRSDLVFCGVGRHPRQHLSIVIFRGVAWLAGVCFYRG